MQKEQVGTPCNSNSAMHVAYTSQLAKMVWNACTPAAELGSVKNAPQTYFLNIGRRLVVEIIKNSVKWYILQSERWFCSVGGRVMPWRDAEDVLVGPNAIQRRNTQEKALQYLAFLMVSAWHYLFENSKLRTVEDEELGD